MKFKKLKPEELKPGKIKEDVLAKPVFMPEQIKIDTVKYTAKEYEYILSGNRSVMGQINYEKSEIQISEKISAENKKLVLMHEITHGITVERDVKDIIPEEHYEKVVDEIAKGFLQLIRDNPALINYIQ